MAVNPHGPLSELDCLVPAPAVTCVRCYDSLVADIPVSMLHPLQSAVLPAVWIILLGTSWTAPQLCSGSSESSQLQQCKADFLRRENPNLMPNPSPALCTPGPPGLQPSGPLSHPVSQMWAWRWRLQCGASAGCVAEDGAGHPVGSGHCCTELHVGTFLGGQALSPSDLACPQL